MPDALEQARALDEEFARTGALKGPLHGIPFVIKDQFDTFDMRTTAGAVAAYANDRPPADAEVVTRLRKAGAIILGKGNMGEYASGDRSTYGGTTCNPYDTSRSAGRSSGGVGAAVAANLTMCGIGEETGPSARNPASNNSLVGIVATHSLVSRAGIIPASMTRDRPGVLCRSVADAATVLSALAGYDPRDVATAESMGRVSDRPYQSFAANADLRGLRIGVIREFMQPFTRADEDSVRIGEEALHELTKAGATLVDPGPKGALFRDAIAAILPQLDPAALETAYPELYPSRTSQLASSLELTGNTKLSGSVSLRLLADREPPTSGEVLFVMNRYLRERGDKSIRSVSDLLAKSTFFNVGGIDGVTLPPKRRLEDLSAERLDIAGWHTVRTTLQMLVDKVMADNRLDALVYPTKTIPAPLLANPVEPTTISSLEYHDLQKDRTVVRVTDLRAPLAPRLSPNAGLPVVVVPAGFTREVYDRVAVRTPDGGKKAGELAPPKAVALPVSIDFLGRKFSEATLIRIAAAYEQATHHRRAPADFPRVAGEP
jgi:Asp-tRNA(Asn)/Glu-tRNA(Gln) amidotransferase A subunit family amidase